MKRAYVSPWLAGVILFIASGCAHSQARCDRRPASPEHPPPEASIQERDWYRRRQMALQEIKQLNESGMKSYRAAGRERGGSHFGDIVELLRYDMGGGEFLYERLNDGHWAYRCDDMTRLYALAAYHYALVYADYRDDQPNPGYYSDIHFCIALHARPDVVLPLAQREGLSKKARVLFEAAKRDPSCYVENGWRTRTASPQRPKNISFAQLVGEQ